MDIVFNIDDRYTKHLCVVLLSIMRFHIKEEICFHILSSNISEDNKEYISKLAKSKDAKVLFYYKSLEQMSMFPTGKGTCNERLTSAAYLRLFIADLLDIGIHKVLYLDCDIIVNGSLKELWDSDINGYSLAAVDDTYPFCETEAERLGFGDKYFNSGMMLLNLDDLRERGFVRQAISFAQSSRTKIFYHDQDILNALLHADRLSLSNKWNQMNGDVVDAKTVIIHFAGIYKPWHKECIHPYKQLYFDYLAQTRWQDEGVSYYYTSCQRLINHLRIIRNHLLFLWGKRGY